MFNNPVEPFRLKQTISANYFPHRPANTDSCISLSAEAYAAASTPSSSVRARQPRRAVCSSMMHRLTSRSMSLMRFTTRRIAASPSACASYTSRIMRFAHFGTLPGLRASAIQTARVSPSTSSNETPRPDQSPSRRRRLLQHRRVNILRHQE